MLKTYPLVRLLQSFIIWTIILLLSACSTTEKKPVTWNSSQRSTNNAVKEALQLQGQPYVPGGESPSEGFDCSGLVVYVYKKQGLKLPRDTWSLVNQLPSVQMEQRQPGDLLFFTINTRKYSHVGIYVGDDKFIHAPSTRTGRVMVSDLNQPYWRERFAAVRRPQINRSLSLNDLDLQACLSN